MASLADFFEQGTGSPSGGYRTGGYSPYSLPGAYPRGFIENKYALDSAMRNTYGESKARQNTWRTMNDTDRLFANANQLVDTLANGASETLGFGRWNPDEGFTPQNIGRFVVNLPGQMLSIFPDALVKGGEILTGNPYSEADLETGLMPDYQLNANQKAADLGYLALDALGFVPGLGMEARAAGMLTKAAGAARGAARGSRAAKAAANAGEEILEETASRGTGGLIKNAGVFEARSAAKNAGKSTTGSMALDTAMDIGGSTLFEGAQEAAQTFMEDIRYDQFGEGTGDRMLTSGLWGALGGGVVSGLANATSGIASAVRGPNDNPKQESSFEFERELADNKSDKDGLLLDSAIQRIKEWQAQDNYVPGSSSLLATVIDPSMNLMQCGCGESDLHAMLLADDNGASLKAIADGFHTTTGVIENIEKMESQKDRAEAYKKLIAEAKARGLKVTVKIGRNPDTGIGIATFDLEDVFVGHGLNMNRLAYMMFGGDVDGDKNQIHFGKGVQSGGYLTAQLKSPASGASRLNRDYVTYSNSSDNLSYQRKYADNLGARFGLTEKAVKWLKKSFEECFDENGEINLEKLTTYFDNVRSLIQAQVRIQQQKAKPNMTEEEKAAMQTSSSYQADSEVAAMMKDLSDHTVSFTTHINNIAAQFTEDQAKAIEDLRKVVNNIGDKYLRSGDTRGATHFAQFAAELGYRIASTTNLGNPFFRQVGQVYYRSQKDITRWFADMSEEDVVNVYDAMIAFSFRLSDIGGDVESSIEGIWRISVQDAMMKVDKSSVAGGWDAWMDQFVKVRDKQAEVFNKCLEKQTTAENQDVALSKASKKNKISQETDESKRKAMIAREFAEIFGDMHVEDVLDISNDNYAYGMTFNQLAKETTTAPGRWGGYFANYNGFDSFWKTYIDQFNWKEGVVGRRIELAIEKMSQEIAMVMNHIKKTTDQNGKEHWVVEPEYFEAWRDVADSWALIMSPDTAIRLHLDTFEKFIDTRWGKALLSGDATQTKNAILSIYETDKWQTVIDIATTKDIDNDPAAWNQLEKEAEKIAGDSVLDTIIYAMIKNNHSVEGLKQITSLDFSYEAKERYFEAITLGNYGHGSILSAAMSTDDSQMTITSVTDRLKRANQKMTGAMKRMGDYHKAVVQNIRDAIDSGRYTSEDLFQACKDFSENEYVAVSPDVIASFVYSQRDVVKAMVEKGTTPTSSDMVYQMAANIVQGGNLSFLDQFGVELGVMKVGDWQSNRIQIMRILFDPTAEIRVWDPEREGYARLTQKALYNEFGIQIPETGPTHKEFLMLLDAAPQLASVIAPTNLDVVYDQNTTRIVPGNAVSLDRAIDNWKKNGVNRSGQKTEDQIRTRMLNDLICDPEWWGMLIASTRNVHESMTLNQTKAAVNAAIEQQLDFYQAWASSPQGALDDYAKAAFWGDAYTDMFEMMEDVFDGHRVLQIYMDLTGSIDSGIVNRMASSLMAMDKAVALNNLFSKYSFLGGFDVNLGEIGDSTKSYVAGLKEQVEKERLTLRKTYLSLAQALIHMIPSSKVDLHSLIRNEIVDSRAAAFLDNKQREAEQIQDEAERQKVLDQISEVRAKIAGWGNGIHGLSEYFHVETGEEVPVNQEIEDLAITDGDLKAGYSADEWVEKCRKIMDRYGKLDDFTKKAEKDIREAVEGKDLERIKAYYNNVIVKALLLDLTEGTGKTINFDAASQALQARMKMAQIGEQMRAKYGDILETRNSESGNRVQFPEIRYHYDIPAVSYMSASGIMNAKAGSVASGIGIDGAMTKTMAAFAALPIDHECASMGTTIPISKLSIKDHIGLSYIDETDGGKLKRFREPADISRIKRSNMMAVTIFDPSHCLSWSCKKCAPASHSGAHPRVNLVAHAISELCNWMQEPRHLQAKKKAGFEGLIVEGLDPESELLLPAKFELKGNDPSSAVLNGILDVLYSRRNKLATLWNEKFKLAKDDLALGMEHAIAFANAMTPVIEVETEQNGIVLVSTSELANPDLLKQRHPELGDPANILTVRPVIVSLQEASQKIMRALCRAYNNSENGSKMTAESVRKIALSAYSDWSGYSSTPLDIGSIVRGIRAYDRSYTTGMPADTTPTPKMLWNEQSIPAIRHVMNQSKKVRRQPDKYFRDRIIAVYEASGLVGNCVVAHSNNISQDVSDPILKQSFSEYGQLTGEGDGDLDTLSFNGNSHTLAELFISDKKGDERIRKDAINAYERAMSNNRKFICSAGTFDLIPSSVISDTVKSFATKFTLRGHELVLVMPEMTDIVDYYRGNHMRMATNHLDPREIGVAMAAPEALQLPDAGHWTRADYEANHTWFASSRINTSRFLDGTTPIELVTDWTEIGSIDPESVVYDFYERQPKAARINQGVLKDAVRRFISTASSNSGRPMIQTDVTRNSCIGFVKQQQGLKTVYAPIFYTGNVAETAQVAYIKQISGDLQIMYSTDKVDYNGNESMKLDLYGVAYKSVGHALPDSLRQYWGMIDDTGLGFVDQPDHMFDFHALESRVIEMSDSVVQNNLFYFTRKTGMNIFFTIDRATKKLKKNDCINWQTQDNPDGISLGDIRDLLSGKYDTWRKVASRELNLIKKVPDGKGGFIDDAAKVEEANRIISNVVKELQYSSGYPHLFFCARSVSLDADGETIIDNGIVPRDMTFRMALKNFSRDHTLKLFALFDSRLCPYGWEAGATDRNEIFDRSGMMKNYNTGVEGGERVYTLVGPHYYTGQGTAVGNLSKMATYSDQHMVKRMLELGVFPPKISDWIQYMGFQVGIDMDSVDSETAAERLAKENRERGYKQLPKEQYELISRYVKDPVSALSVDRYRQVLSTMLEETTRPISIVQEDLKTKAWDDPQIKNKLNAARESLNSAAKFKDSRDQLSWTEILTLVRYEMGYTENSSKWEGLTYGQVLDSIERMKENLKKDGLFISAREVVGERGDIRLSIPLLPRGLSMRLMSSEIIKSKFGGRDHLDSFIDAQKVQLEQAVDYIKKIEDKPKRKALFRFADAAAYANGMDSVSGYIYEDVYMEELVSAAGEIFANAFDGYSPELREHYLEKNQLTKDYIAKLRDVATRKKSSLATDSDGKKHVLFHTDDRTIAQTILRTLASSRRGIGMTYVGMLPANITERAVNQTMQSGALALGRAGIGPYTSDVTLAPEIRRECVRDKEFKKLYAAYRQAELLGVDRQFLAAITSGKDLKTAIEETFKSMSRYEQIINKIMDVASGGNALIEGQMLNFLDRFVQRSSKEAKWWHMKAEGSNMTILESKLAENPSKWFLDIMGGSTTNPGADLILARQCMNWAKRGDMAQKNIVSAIYAEIASRSAGADFLTTAFISPYFQYATNRIGRILQWVAPISSIHYVITDAVTKGKLDAIKIGGNPLSHLALEDVQFNANLKEAIMIDMIHLGPVFVAFIALGMAGAIEPPEDEDKWGNFKEWTIFGNRIDVAWWLEDVLGLSLPIMIFGKSAQLGKPRLDLITNGIAYYLSNNPVTKIADIVSVLLDPMSELQQEYDKDVQGYAKAMGGAPSMSDIVNGKTTSFGLSFVSQFITPGFLKEIYTASLEYEPDYKRVYETDATGRLTEAAREQNKTQYTSYQDAIVRKFTRTNPVMGWLADLVLQPTTGYMAREMPNRIIYDPIQMNSLEAYSLYEDPWTKKVPKSEQDKLATCLSVINELQSKSVDRLYQEGFILDYDTKVYVGKYIWDNIATLNSEWAALEQAGSLDYYTAGEGDWTLGQQRVSKLKEDHYRLVNELKSLYYDKLWNSKLNSPAQYNQLHTKWAQDANGEWYATGFYPSWFSPITIGPSETPEGYQYVMSRENDWQTESIVTGEATGIRGLRPREAGKVTVPNIESYSEDGTDTGHSDIYNNNASPANSEKGTKSTTPSSGRPSTGSRGYGGSGGGGGYTPSAYVPSVSLPKTNTSRIMTRDRLQRPQYDYLRPDFETKGSREAYKRSDI